MANSNITGPMGALAVNARIRRMAYNLSAKEVAERAGLSPEMVRRIEWGDPTVRLSALAAHAAAFGASVHLMLKPIDLPPLPDNHAAPAAQQEGE